MSRRRARRQDKKRQIPSGVNSGTQVKRTSGVSCMQFAALGGGDLRMNRMCSFVLKRSSVLWPNELRHTILGIQFARYN